jgi:lipopolysaccharide export system protein LptA
MVSISMEKISQSKNKSLALPVRLLLCLVFSVSITVGFAQQKVRKVIQIENAEYLLYDQTINTNAQRLIGNVKLSHNNMVLFCDSAWSYTVSNSVDCFGNVHIISNDTLHLYAKTIKYKGDESMANARGEVVLKNPTMTLTTDSLDFDTKNEIGYYDKWGKIVDSTNTLTSRVGTFFSQQNEMFFRDSVKLVNPEYVMTSDTMKYNTQTEVVHILGPTHIIGDSSYLYSENGWFDTKNNTSELLKNSTIRKGDTQLEGDYIFYNDNTGQGNARGNVIINDYKNSIIVAGNKASYNDFSQYAYVTDSALFIQYSNSDSLFLHADTLYTQPDTTVENQKKVLTYRNVRFYKTDMQGICDSLVYFTKDSTIQLHIDPVLWAEKSQMTANYIELINNSEPPSIIDMKENSFIIQENDSMKFNQIKGKDMVGLIAESKLYRIDVSGNGQSIYYPADEKTFIGMNKAESSNIILYLADNKINRISFIKSPIGTLSPIVFDKIDPESRLEGFNWRGGERPLNKLDIFRSSSGGPLPENLPNSAIDNTLPSVEGLRDSTIELLQDQKSEE